MNYHLCIQFQARKSGIQILEYGGGRTDCIHAGVILTLISKPDLRSGKKPTLSRMLGLLSPISRSCQGIINNDAESGFSPLCLNYRFYFAGIQGNAGAAILSNDQAVYAKVQGVVSFIGNGLQPMDCFMTQRGLKTLGLRLDHQLKASEDLAQKLRDKGLDVTSVAGILKIANEEKNEEALVRFKRVPKQSSNVTHIENELVFLGIEEVDDLFEELLKVYI